MGVDHVIPCILSAIRIKPKSVKEVMLPTTISGWIVGMGVIEYPLGNPWPVTSFFWALVLIILFGFVVVIGIEEFDKIIKCRPTVSAGSIFKSLIYGNVGLNIFGIILSWLRMKKIKIILDRLEYSDKKLKKIGASLDHRMIYLRQLILLITQIFHIVFFMVVALYWHGIPVGSKWLKIAFAVSVYYPVFITTIGDLSFITLIRFVCFNRY